MENFHLPHFNYIAAIFLIVFGLYAMIAEKNLIRKIIGMAVFQTGIILFYISLAVKDKAGIPVIPEALLHGHIPVEKFANPLPHALMLTAIVVGVSTLGVALTLVLSIYRQYGTVEEDEIIKEVDPLS